MQNWKCGTKRSLDQSAGGGRETQTDEKEELLISQSRTQKPPHRRQNKSMFDAVRLKVLEELRWFRNVRESQQTKTEEEELRSSWVQAGFTSQTNLIITFGLFYHH